MVVDASSRTRGAATSTVSSGHVHSAPNDEAWIEEELQRELQALGDVELSDSNCSDLDHDLDVEGSGGASHFYAGYSPYGSSTTHASGGEERPPRELPPAATASPRHTLLAEEELSESFQELMRCLRGRAEEEAQEADTGVEEVHQLVQDLELQLLASRGKKVPQPDPEVPLELDGIQLEEEDRALLAQATEEAERAVSIVQEPVSGEGKSLPEAVKEVTAEGGELEEDDAGNSVESFEQQRLLQESLAAQAAQFAAQQRQLEEERVARIAELECEQAELEARLLREAALRREQELRLQQEFEEQRRRDEIARVARIAAFERERRELHERTLRENEQRRAEERRCREVAAMQSEESRLREFYYEERRTIRRELWEMSVEDRWCQRWREEERRARENEERGRELAERNALSREDLAGRKRRELEKEAFERIEMGTEDLASRRAGEELRRLKEIQMMIASDEEARRYMAAMQEAKERQRMMNEDDLSDILRYSLAEGEEEGEAVDTKAEGASPFSPSSYPRRPAIRRAFESVAAALSAALSGVATSVPFSSAEGALKALVGAGRPQRPKPSGAGPVEAPAPACGPTKLAVGLTHTTARAEARAAAAAQVANRAAGLTEASKKRSVGDTSTSQSGAQGACAVNENVPFRRCQTFDPWADDDLAEGGAAASAAATPELKVATRAAALRAQACGVDRTFCSCSSALCAALSASFQKKDLGNRVRKRPSAHVPEPPLPTPVYGPSACSTARALLQNLGIGAEAVPGFVGEVGGAEPHRLARLDLKFESLSEVPDFRSLPDLRVLHLTGNRLRNVRPLRFCQRLEELSLCQQADGVLTTLDGLETLSRLAVLRATQNRLSDASALEQLSALRHVELGKNCLSRLVLRAPHLARLDLYRNELKSTGFLEHLPSLTYLDLGRNKLTEVDSRLSSWNPILQRLRLHENKLKSLPELRLPLLTEIGVDNNVIEVLGPLGFLPSLEWLSAAHNQIAVLGSPLATSPLLHSVALSGNNLASSESLRPLFLHPRLRSLQLNDNPLGPGLFEKYRPWILEQAPGLVELDSDLVPEAESLAAAAARATSCVSLAYDLNVASAASGSSVQAVLTLNVAFDADIARRPTLTHGAHRTGGLFDLVAPSTEADVDDDFAPPVGGGARGGASTEAHRPPSPVALINVQRVAALKRWGGASRRGRGCAMCALALRCEAAATARAMALATNSRQERRAAALPRSFRDDEGRAEVLFTQRLRRDFWAAFLDLCCEQLEVIEGWSSSAGESSVVWRPLAFEQAWSGLGVETHAKQRSALRLQALFRGCAERRRLEAEGVELPGAHHKARRLEAVTRLQAVARGSRVRRRLRWAKELSRAVDKDLEDCPEIDVDAMLGLGSLGLIDPFVGLQVPGIGPLSARPSLGSGGPSSSLPPSTFAKVASVAGRPSGVEAQPRLAWSSPLGTPQAPLTTASFIADGLRGGASPASDAGSSRPGSGLGRCRSLSSTAESAQLESPGLLGVAREQHIAHQQASVGYKTPDDDPVAQAYLAARNRAKGTKPPKPPGGSSQKRLGGPGSTSGGLAGAGGVGGLHSQPIAFTQSARGKKGGGTLIKAQDAIAEARRAQDEAAKAQAAQMAAAGGGDDNALEFRSGEPNRLLLLRSGSRSGNVVSPSMSPVPATPPGASPRARSPLRLGAFSPIR